MEKEKTKLMWSKTAIVGFILSLLWIYGIGSLAAVVLGIISLRKINRSNLKGKSFSIASIILGGIGLILPLWILTAVLWTIIANA